MAEKITVGGVTLEIDENDELWKQLVEKYSEGRETGWEIPNEGAKAYTLYGGSPQGDYCIGAYNPLADHNVVNHAAIFADYKFARMQARAEEIRRKMLRWVAENDKPLRLRDDHWGLIYNADTYKWQAVCYNGRPNIFGVYCSSETLALEFAMFFEDELKWMFFEYKRRLDEE